MCEVPHMFLMCEALHTRRDLNPPTHTHREVYGVDVSVAAAHLPVLLLHGGKDLIVPFQKVRAREIERERERDREREDRKSVV